MFMEVLLRLFLLVTDHALFVISEDLDSRKYSLQRNIHWNEDLPVNITTLT